MVSSCFQPRDVRVGGHSGPWGTACHQDGGATRHRQIPPPGSGKVGGKKAEFQAMLDEEVICCSSSQWSSPLHMDWKKDGSWQPCGDYHQLNLQTVWDKYPLPNMVDLAARLDVCTIFSKLDLHKGYLQVPVANANVPKKAIITPFGLFEF